MADLDREKTVAAAAAVALVQDGMRVGLGTGSTAAIAVKLLGERVRGGLRITGIPTSERTRELATQLGIPLTDFTKTQELDIAIDGADEADRRLRLIKGGGGALLREKIVASTAKRFVVIADSSKLVERLGKFPLPVEVVKFAAPLVAKKLAALGGAPTLRTLPTGAPFVTDEGNHILDARFGAIADPESVARALADTPGVVDHGLFLGMTHTLVVGRGDRAEVIERP
jgi:ribose 5-phosphate isomerase A